MSNQTNTAAGKLIVRQPFDGAVIDELELQPWPRVDAMLVVAQNAYRDISGRLPAWRRIEILRNLAKLMDAEKQNFAMLIAREGGKPLRDALVETERAVGGVELAADEISHIHGSEIPMDLSEAGSGRIAFSRKEPVGVVVAISAFNHPLNLIVHQIMPAIATNCPVIIKPADTTPLSCIKLVELVHRAGLPEPLCQVCLCDIPVAERLATDERVGFFSFIGSAKVGWYLRSKLAPGTRCALEHGGAAPALICHDADLDYVIPSLVKGGYYHAGQVCVSVQRIFVDNRIKDEFCEAYSAEVKKLKTGDPTHIDTDVGPLILPREVSRVETWVDEAKKAGAKCLDGGTKISDTHYFPTVLVEPPADTKVSSLEIFGPITCIYGFDTSSEAIHQANSLSTAFQASIFTRNLDHAITLSNQIDASAVMINDHTAFRTDWMPFAGRRTSGLGTGGIPHTMADMLQEKMTVIKTRPLSKNS